jgi:WD40 repeat protein
VTDLEGNMRVIDLETGGVREAPQVPGFPTHLSFSPDGETLAVVTEGGFELRDGHSLRVVASLRNRAGDDDRWVRFSPDGRLLAVTSLAGYTQLWDVDSREPVGPRLEGHEFDVYNAEFSPDGRLLATSGFDGAVILWDVESRRALGTMPGPLGPTSTRFAPDSRTLFVLHDPGEAKRVPVEPDAWSEHACLVAGRGLSRAEWEELAPDQDYRSVCS